MKKHLIVILCFISLSILSQEEKRLALVIGNGNYDKGALKNPVNDAALIRQTLEELDFEVIYATNLERKRSMVDKIAEFGRKRSNFDVGFVYYAGHGIQVGGENYLLPTKEIFESEYDVEDYGVSVQKIMRYLTGMSQQVNVLILDACRDNPFESYWNKSRSLKGAGLAKIPPPTGSLIAFSTSANTTASDGSGDNSYYCQSLSKNLRLENTSIDQVFRNVRSEVVEFSKGLQIPEEASKLVGDAFYLIKNEKLKFAYEILSISDDSLKMFINDYEKWKANIVGNKHKSKLDPVTIIGEVKNYINPEDINFTIKVTSTENNKTIELLELTNSNIYKLVLNPGKYFFIVESRLSERIHKGLVIVPETEHVAIAQEMELIKVKNKGETLVILNLFDEDASKKYKQWY